MIRTFSTTSFRSARPGRFVMSEHSFYLFEHSLMQRQVIPHEKVSFIVWHMKQQELDGLQLAALSDAQVNNMREREKIVGYDGQQRIACGTSYRFSVNILRTIDIKE